MIKYQKIVQETKEAILEAQTTLPNWVISKLEKRKKEEKEPAKTQIQNILKNTKIAQKEKKPICQDTGLPMFFTKIGNQVDIDFSIKKALTQATKEATEEIPLRPSVVSPLKRKNTGNNTGKDVPIINYEIIKGNKLEVVFFPKGAGSENMSKQKMLNPGEKNGLVDWIVEKVKEAGPKPCPPVFLGIGIGGSFDYSAKLSKKALLELPQRSDDEMGRLEEEILEKVNSLNIGPMGLGGETTALDVSIKKAHCHTASLPVSLNIQCWANRISKRVFEE